MTSLANQLKVTHFSGWHRVTCPHPEVVFNRTAYQKEWMEEGSTLGSLASCQPCRLLVALRLGVPGPHSGDGPGDTICHVPVTLRAGQLGRTH